MKNFVEMKQRLISKLLECKTRLIQVEDLLNIDLTEQITKLEKVIKDIENEQLNVVMFGAFSDGKSTIISALLKKSDIPIAPEPTTDNINLYKSKDFFIVDTPGLFSEKIEHAQITKKYISQADLVIFTVDATNPIKESQLAAIKWILKDLGKISQTIFVINKMDTTGVDLEDRQEYKEICEDKKASLIKTLKEIIPENHQYRIVCLSADPYERGIEYWLKNKNEYEKLSNIKELENTINEVIKENRYKLIQDKVISVLKDISITNEQEFRNQVNVIKLHIQNLENHYKELYEEVRNINSELSKSVTRIKKKLDAYRDEIITNILSSSDFNDLRYVVTKYIGKEGQAIGRKIDVIFREELQSVQEYIGQTINTIENISKFYEQLDYQLIELTKAGAGFIKYISGVLKTVPSHIVRNALINIRNILNLPIKFKPWQAIKIAKNTQIALVIVGEFIDVAIKFYTKYKLNQRKEELIKAVENIIIEAYKFADERTIKEQVFKAILDLEKMLENIKEDLNYKNNILLKLKEAEQILKECNEVSL